jgi:ring-1,2-phenylacetyl-CoA epoxidase subunit PaaC
MEAQTASPVVERPAELSDESRLALRDLILTLADNKRLLGLRYSDWMLGAPSLETGIAASSMAQDEWGHGRLTYALLGEFGEDPKHLEHERDAGAYHGMEALDSRFASWAEMIAASLLLDTALTVQYAALLHSCYSAVHNRVQKLLDEELFHFQYASGWVEKLGAARGARADLVGSMSRLLPMALRWLGRPEDPALRRLQAEGLVREGPDGLRLRYLARVGPVLQRAGIADDLGLSDAGTVWDHAGGIDWTGWDDRRRRASAGGPDADTLARARGDKNRAMLLD